MLVSSSSLGRVTMFTVVNSIQLIPDGSGGNVYMTFVMRTDVTQANANSYVREKNPIL